MAASRLLIYSLFLISCRMNPSPEKELTDLMAAYDIAGLQVAAAVDGETVFSWHGGWADPINHRPMQADTRMRIASQTKMVTTLAVLSLVADSLVSLDEDVSHYLGFTLRNPYRPAAKITLRQLLSHTSSLKDGPEYDRFIVESLARNGTNPLRDFLTGDTDSVWSDRVPGAYFAYCNLGYVIAGTLVERVSGERFDRYIRRRILQPAGVDASTNVSDFDAPDRLGVLVRKVNGRWIAQNDAYDALPPDGRFDAYTPGTNALPFGAQGGLRISATAMLRILELIRCNGQVDGTQVLPAGLIALMKTMIWKRNGTNGGDGEKYGGQFAAWGLGMHIAGLQESDAMIPGTIWFGHPGEAYGLLSGGYTDGRRTLVFILNGMGEGWTAGPRTGYYRAEEAIYGVIEHIFMQHEAR